jgi:hypothetical protein
MDRALSKTCCSRGCFSFWPPLNVLPYPTACLEPEIEHRHLLGSTRFVGGILNLFVGRQLPEMLEIGTGLRKHRVVFGAFIGKRML